VPNDERTLGDYIQDLIAALTQDDPAAAQRLRRVVGHQRAVIGLDEESVEVQFDVDGTLTTSTTSSNQADGSGRTDRTTVLELLAGRDEASRAVLEGRIEVAGSPDAVAAILLAIEILLDVSSRSPTLQAIARDFTAAAQSRDLASIRPMPVTAWYPRARPDAEEQLLTRLGLIRDRSSDAD
jgi:ubiquinone biosynthesis protein UbiJ